MIDANWTKTKELEIKAGKKVIPRITKPKKACDTEKMIKAS